MRFRFCLLKNNCINKILQKFCYHKSSWWFNYNTENVIKNKMKRKEKKSLTFKDFFVKKKPKNYFFIKLTLLC